MPKNAGPNQMLKTILINKEDNLLKMQDLVTEQYDLLCHCGKGFTEIRDVKTGKQWFTSTFADYCTVIAEYIDKKEDIYVGINPRKTKSGKADDVAYINNLVIDVDPIRGKGVGSTDAQLNEAIAVAREISKAYTNAIIAVSGSGAHIYFPLVPIEPTPDLKLRIEAWTNGIQAKYNSKTIRIDSTFDLPRVMRVWGSWNNKSNRRCELLEPLDKISRVTIESIVGLVAAGTFQKGSSLATLSEAEIRFERLLKNNATLQNIVSGNISFVSRSEADYSFSRVLLLAGFVPKDISELLVKNPGGRGNEKSIGERIKDVERIAKKMGPTGVSTISEEYFQDLETRKTGIMTGFTMLDDKLSGLKPGRLYVIAARPTDGKTTFLTQLATNIADTGKKVLFFPTEVGASSLYDKVLSRKLSINLKKFQTGSFTVDEKDKIKNIKSSLTTLPLLIIENFALKVKDIKYKAEETLPDLIIIDFLQSMMFEKGGEPRELGQAVVTIKSLAQQLQIPVILASQLHRAADGAKASLTQLKGTGVIEEQGDDIMYLYTLDRMAYPKPVVLDIMKSKYGEPARIKMDFFASHCNFVERAII